MPTPPEHVLTVAPNANRSFLQRFIIQWSDGPVLSYPVASFKCFVCLLLLIEVNDLMVPEQSILYTPELVRIVRGHACNRPPAMPHLTEVLLPGLDDSTADSWARVLGQLRAVLLISWCTCLAAPYRWGLFAPLYSLGALAYFLLGSLGLQWNPAHSTQAGMLFVLSAVLVSGDLHRSSAAQWLIKFLFVCVLIPVYLFAGISKMRYMGVLSQFEGGWMAQIVSDNIQRSTWPAISKWIMETPLAQIFMSFGDVAFQDVLSLLTLFYGLHRSSRIAWALRNLYCLVGQTFHFINLVLIGPNFIRMSLLLLLAANPFGIASAEKGKQIEAALTKLDYFRGGFATFVLCYWIGLQIIPSLRHVAGFAHGLPVDDDPYWPIPALNMFCRYPGAPLHVSSIVAVVSIFATFVWKTDGEVVAMKCDEPCESD
jgi:hypothetical protein